MTRLVGRLDAALVYRDVSDDRRGVCTEITDAGRARYRARGEPSGQP
ncbi:hypothetical protein [Nocardia sp. NPDC051463]